MRHGEYDNAPSNVAMPVATASTAPTVDDLDAVFKGFADPTRIRILSVLSAGELCVCDIVDILRLPQPAVSRHLAYLRRMGLVEATREWKFAHYRLAEPEHAVHQNLLNCVRTCFRGIKSLDRERVRAEARVKARASEPC
jgi:ArsR family transcriptional regulator